MGVNIKELHKIPERLGTGHRLCSGCGAPIVAKMVMMGFLLACMCMIITRNRWDRRCDRRNC